MTTVEIPTTTVAVTDSGVDVALSIGAATTTATATGGAGPQGATGPGVAAGGTTGQYLRKDSATDYDTSWDTIGTGDVDGLDSALAGKATPAGLWLPGASGNYVSAPDAAALSVTGDIDIRVRVALSDWTGAAIQTLVAKYGSSSTRSYMFDVMTDGTLRLRTSSDGSATIVNGQSTAATGLTDGSSAWLRVTLDVDNGSASRVYNFYTADDSPTMPTSWTQLGSTVTTAGTTSLFDSTSVVEIGSTTVGTQQLATGTFRRVQILSGIGGSIAGEWRSDWGAARFRDTAANIWTVNGTANAWME
jgi:hypothetical protein